MRTTRIASSMPRRNQYVTQYPSCDKRVQHCEFRRLQRHGGMIGHHNVDYRIARSAPPCGDLIGGKNGHISYQSCVDEVPEIDHANDSILVVRIDEEIHVVHVVVNHLLPQMPEFRLNSC